MTSLPLEVLSLAVLRRAANLHRRSKALLRAALAAVVLVACTDASATRLAYRMGKDPLARARVREILEEEARAHG